MKLSQIYHCSLNLSSFLFRQTSRIFLNLDISIRVRVRVRNIVSVRVRVRVRVRLGLIKVRDFCVILRNYASSVQ